jgi:hypothetical protein
MTTSFAELDKVESNVEIEDTISSKHIIVEVGSP